MFTFIKPKLHTIERSSFVKTLHRNRHILDNTLRNDICYKNELNKFKERNMLEIGRLK